MNRDIYRYSGRVRCYFDNNDRNVKTQMLVEPRYIKNIYDENDLQDLLQQLEYWQFDVIPPYIMMWTVYLDLWKIFDTPFPPSSRPPPPSRLPHLLIKTYPLAPTILQAALQLAPEAGSLRKFNRPENDWNIIPATTMISLEDFRQVFIARDTHGVDPNLNFLVESYQGYIPCAYLREAVKCKDYLAVLTMIGRCNVEVTEVIDMAIDARDCMLAWGLHVTFNVPLTLKQICRAGDATLSGYYRGSFSEKMSGLSLLRSGLNSVVDIAVSRLNLNQFNVAWRTIIEHYPAPQEALTKLLRVFPQQSLDDDSLYAVRYQPQLLMTLLQQPSPTNGCNNHPGTKTFILLLKNGCREIFDAHVKDRTDSFVSPVLEAPVLEAVGQYSSQPDTDPYRHHQDFQVGLLKRPEYRYRLASASCYVLTQIFLQAIQDQDRELLTVLLPLVQDSIDSDNKSRLINRALGSEIPGLVLKLAARGCHGTSFEYLHTRVRVLEVQEFLTALDPTVNLSALAWSLRDYCAMDIPRGPRPVALDPVNESLDRYFSEKYDLPHDTTSTTYWYQNMLTALHQINLFFRGYSWISKLVNKKGVGDHFLMAALDLGLKDLCENISDSFQLNCLFSKSSFAVVYRAVARGWNLHHLASPGPEVAYFKKNVVMDSRSIYCQSVMTNNKIAYPEEFTDVNIKNKYYLEHGIPALFPGVEHIPIPNFIRLTIAQTTTFNEV